MKSSGLIKDSFSLVDSSIRCFTSRFEQYIVGLSAARPASIWKHREGRCGPTKVLHKLRAEVGSCVWHLPISALSRTGSATSKKAISPLISKRPLTAPYSEPTIERPTPANSRYQERKQPSPFVARESSAAFLDEPTSAIHYWAEPQMIRTLIAAPIRTHLTAQARLHRCHARTPYLHFSDWLLAICQPSLIEKCATHEAYKG